MKLKFTAMLLSTMLLLVWGCMSKVTVNKRPNVALPIYSESCPSNNVIKDYVIVDQGYEVKYFKLGFSTDIESMSAEISTNKTVRFSLGGLHSFNSCTNKIDIKVDDLISIFKLFRDTTNDVITIDRNLLLCK